MSWTQVALSYVHNQTSEGLPLHWSNSSSVIDIYVNPSNDQDPSISEESVQSISSNSIAQWNNLSQISLRKNATQGKNQELFNELYFSTDPSVFSNGTAVIGVTLVEFSESSGEIISADILLNDNFTFSSNQLDQNYLGNVITHELGHFLGLGHGQVAGSSMFFSLSLGQSLVSDDDKAGLYSIYPNSNSNFGVLSGTIVGGKNLIHVFGAHVQAYSVKNGKVMGAAISKPNGNFQINGLPKNDQYLIYTSPAQPLGLPHNYANIRSDFCQSSSKYRGSFFQSCNASGEGFPEAVRLSSSTLDIGNITIRCGLDTPTDYIQSKSITPSTFNLNAFTNSGLGGSFVGFFSNSEMLQATPEDYFQIDFSHIEEWDTVSTDPNLFLELKVINQSFYSPLKININVKRSSSSFDIEPKYVQEAGGRVNIDTITRININRSDSSDNNFEIKLTPEVLGVAPSVEIPFSKEQLLSSYSEMDEDLYFYLVSATIVKLNDDGTYTQVASKNDLLSDNTKCPDALNTYAINNFSASGSSNESDRKNAAGCGTVEDSSNGSAGGGPGGFMIGLFFCFIISNGLSRYSKMA